MSLVLCFPPVPYLKSQFTGIFASFLFSLSLVPLQKSSLNLLADSGFITGPCNQASTEHCSSLEFPLCLPSPHFSSSFANSPGLSASRCLHIQYHSIICTLLKELLFSLKEKAITQTFFFPFSFFFTQTFLFSQDMLYAKRQRHKERHIQMLASLYQRRAK